MSSEVTIVGSASVSAPWRSEMLQWRFEGEDCRDGDGEEFSTVDRFVPSPPG